MSLSAMIFRCAAMVSLVSLVTPGCSGDDNNLNGLPEDGGTNDTSDTNPLPGDTENDTGGMVASCADVVSDGMMVITDETNYAFSSTLAIEKSTLRSATNLTVDWSGITTDFFGKAVNAVTDIDLVLLSLWHQTPEQFIENMNRDNLPQSSMVGVITTYPKDNYTSRNLLDFDIQGEPLEPEYLWSYFDTNHPDFEYPQTEYTFMAMAASGVVAGKGARMLRFFTIDPNAPETLLRFTDTSTTMKYTVDLHHAMPVPVPAGVGALTIDWSNMNSNALGNPYDIFQITEAVVAHYPTYNLSQLKKRFLFLEEDAGGWWWGKVKSGVSIDLSTLTDANNAPFPGIDTTGIWLVALFCTGTACNNPAPWSITLLQPC